MDIRNWKRCKRCGEFFDIDTSKDLCPECREADNKREKKNLEDWC